MSYCVLSWIPSMIIFSTLFRIKNKLCGTFYPNIDIFNNIIFQPSCHCNEF